MGISIEKAALSAGANLEKVEEAALSAFNLDSTASKETLTKLADQLGIPKEKQGNLNADGLRQLAKLYWDKASAAYELLSQLLAAKKKTSDVIIGNIR